MFIDRVLWAMQCAKHEKFNNISVLYAFLKVHHQLIMSFFKADL